MRLLVALLMISVVASKCNLPYCLSCASDSSACRLCDFTAGYVLASGSCQKSTIANCARIDGVGACLYCNQGYYINGSTCSAVTSSVTNCQRYTNSAVCSLCNAGYYLKDATTCVAVVGNPVTNCAQYSGATSCIRCVAGYELIGNTCFNSSRTNCYVYSGFTCASCLPNYFKSAASIDVLSSYAANYYTWADNGQDYFNDFTCVPNTDANCAVASAINTCQTCKANYFPVNGVCQAVSQKEGCVAYSSTTACQTCAQGYYLNNSACTKITIDANCLYYSAVNTCTRCKAHYYLDANAACVAVSPQITNCAYYSNATTCAECDIGYALDTNKCYLLKVANCSAYGTTGVCVRCAGLFKLNASNACEAVTEITGCTSYKADGNCAECAPTHYSSSDFKCTAYAVTNCISYDATAACTFCDTGYYLNASKACVSATLTNCKYLSTATTCLVCNENFVRSSDSTTCTPRAAGLAAGVTSCYNYDMTGCVLCAATFKLVSVSSCATATVVTDCEYYNADGTCKYCLTGKTLNGAGCETYVFADVNCQAYTGAATGTPTCLKCVNTHYLNGSGACVTRTATTVDNCATYGSDQGCLTCVTTHFLTADKKCGIRSITDCTIYTLAACDLCASGKKPGATTCDAITAAETVTDCYYYGATGGCKACTTGKMLYGKTCSTTSLIGDSFPVDKCAYYSAAGTCAACVKGYSLAANTCTAITAANLITNCLRYNADATPLCTLCDGTTTDYRLAADSKSCVALLTANCGNYSSRLVCASCAVGYYKNGSVCTATTAVANCALFNTDQTCQLCNTDYFLSGNACLLRAACVVQQSATACATCIANYYVDNGVCKPVTTTVTGCATYSGASTCSVCQAGYAGPQNAKCYANCLSAAAAGCTQCAAGYYLSGADCVQVTTTSIANCQFYSNASTCASCFSGYVLRGNLCYAAVQNYGCAALNDVDNCLVCKTGFAVSNGACVAVTGASSSCAFYSQNSTPKCEVCKTAYYQKSYQGDCAANTTPTPPTSAGILAIFSALFLLFLS